VKAFAANLLLLAVGLCVALAMAEGLAAVASRGRPCSGRVPLWRPDGAVGWALVPGARGDAVVCGANQREIARHRVEINALGHRDLPRHRPRDGRRRVLVLGDSFVEALQVDFDDAFTARLERLLDAEVLNFGVSGYSTDNELRAWAHDGRRYHPDAVLLVLHVGNDVLENGPRLFLKFPHGLPPKPWLHTTDASPALRACLAIDRAAAHLATLLPDTVWARSRLARATFTSAVGGGLQLGCADATGPALIPGVPEGLGVYGEPRTPAWEEGWRETERLLHHLASRVRATGARFGVALGPVDAEYDPQRRWYEALQPATRGHEWDFEYPYRRLGGFLARERVPWTSLVPPLRTHYEVTGDPGSYEWDGHWTASGHAVVAEALAPFVAELLTAHPVIGGLTLDAVPETK